jgi:ankyrin repeat protein
MRSFFLAMVTLISLSHGIMAGSLGDAAKSGDVALVAKLLAEGADINEADTFATALHWAALSDHAEVVAVLAARGADLSANSDALGTPLHAAAQRDHSRVVLVLLDHGANVDSLDKDGGTPLQIAAKRGKLDVTRILIDAGADVNAISIGQGNNPYKLGEQNPLHLALQEQHLEVANILRSAGAVAVPVLSSAEALSGASVDSGRELAGANCRVCHAIEAGDPTPSAGDHGPPLIGIAGQQVARDASFEYSDALREFGGHWTDDRLYSFVLRPMLTVPGTLMGHQLVRKPDEIADIVAYLKSLSQ